MHRGTTGRLCSNRKFYIKYPPYYHMYGEFFDQPILQWVEEGVEKLLPNKVEARNRVLYAMLQLSSAHVDYEAWLENGGILLIDIQLEKKQTKDMLNERVNFILFICINNHKIKILTNHFYRHSLQVSDTRSFAISDQVQRRRLKGETAEVIEETKKLQNEKKKKEESVNEKKKVIDAAKKKVVEGKNKNGKKTHKTILFVEKVLRKHSISKPYYHGGKYNDKAMNALKTNSQVIMEQKE